MAIRARDVFFLTSDNVAGESNYGSTQATLFGKFYERILSRWIEQELGCKREPSDSAKSAIHKPRVYWRSIGIDGFDFAEHQDLKDGMAEALTKLRSHCTPDGAFTKDGKWYVWEAKNWPLYPQNGSGKQILDYLKDHPWVLAHELELCGVRHPIAGFWFSFWCRDAKQEALIREAEQVIKSIVGTDRFKIILTDEVLDDGIEKQHPWYLEVVGQEREHIEAFIDKLLSKSLWLA